MDCFILVRNPRKRADYFVRYVNCDMIGARRQDMKRDKFSEEYSDSLPDKIFSREFSADMWDAINNAKTKDELRLALYFVCCRIQELESKMDGRFVKRKGARHK